MELTFAAPWGALALLAVPALVFVHLLRQRPPEVVTTTLFLLGPAPTRTPRGRSLSALSERAQLAARLLAALVATWLLLEPRWAQEDLGPKVVVVLDSSASMSAFADEVAPALAPALERLSAAGRVRLTVLPSAPDRAPLAGGSGATLTEALGRWRPDLGAHDVRGVLARARRAAGAGGAVIFVTDHAGDDPPGVWRLAVGAPQDNVAFAGLEVVEGEDGARWAAVVRAYTRQPVTRGWRLAAGGATRLEGEVALEPGATRRLSGAFPEGLDRFELVLDADTLTVDDRLPVLRPRRKVLRVYADPEAAARPLVRRLLEVTPRLEAVSDPALADLEITAAEPASRRGASAPRAETVEGRKSQVRLQIDPDYEARPPRAGVVAARHPLTRDLPWVGLVARRSGAVAPEDAQVLLWGGAEPLVWLTPGPSLVVAFDLRGSNAAKVPAFPLMLARFFEDVRARVPREEVLGVEVGQPLSVPARPGAGPLEVVGPEARVEIPEARWSGLSAPATPGFFEVRQGSQVFLRGAARFADVRESDLRSAARVRLPDEALEALVRSRLAPDPYRRIELLGLLGLVVLSFGLGGRVRG